MKTIKLTSTIFILISLFACEVEEILPNEIQDPNGIDLEVEAEIVYTYTPPPCDLVTNSFRFNNSTISNNTVSEDSSSSVGSSCYNANYLVETDNYSSLSKVNFYFKTKPHSGIYRTVANNFLHDDSTSNVYLNIRPNYSSSFIAAEGTLVYVKNDGDTLKLSFCSSDFSSYGNSSFVIANNYGEFIIY